MNYFFLAGFNMKTFMKTLKIFLSVYVQASGGLIVFGLFFAYGIANNLSFSYMGNSSETAKKFIMDNFLGEIIFFILKLVVIYAVLGIIFGLAGRLILNSYQKHVRGKFFSMKVQIMLNSLISFILYLPFFMKNIILYPQVYMNGFYSKSPVFKSVTEFLTDSVSPVFFTVLQIVFLVLMTGIFIYSLKNTAAAIIEKHRKHIFRYSVPVAAAALAATAFMAFNGDSGLNRDENRPNVIILASDALRPDHISANGYKRATTPNIDKIIESGIDFKNANIEIPRTFPSWVSTLTGQFASTHGIRHMFPTSRDLNRNFRALPELLNKNGYETSVIGDYAADIFTRIDLGFKHVDTPYFNADHILYQAILDAHVFLMPFLTNQKGLDFFTFLKDSAYFCPPELVTERIMKYIKNTKGKPFFITTFFSSTHFPYAPPYPYYKTYAEKGYTGPYKYLKQQIIALDNQKVSKTLSETDKRQVNALYDGGLHAFDREVGRIIKFLEKNGLKKNTVIIVLSDHGENLYEGKLGMGHGEHFRGLYATRIPLIINYAGLTDRRKDIKSLVRNVDLAPTILELMKVKNTFTMEGKSLIPVIKGTEKQSRFAYGETGIWFDNSRKNGLFFQNQRIMYPDITGLSMVDFHFDKQVVLNDNYRDIINMAKHRYIFDGRYRLIYIPLQDRIEYELYDTEKDPLAENNIASRRPDIVKRLSKELFRWVTRNSDVMVKNGFIYPLSRY